MFYNIYVDICGVNNPDVTTIVVYPTSATAVCGTPNPPQDQQPMPTILIHQSKKQNSPDKYRLGNVGFPFNVNL